MPITETELLKGLYSLQNEMIDMGWSLATSKEYAWSELEDFLEDSNQCLKCIRKKFFSQI